MVVALSSALAFRAEYRREVSKVHLTVRWFLAKPRILLAVLVLSAASVQAQTESAPKKKELARAFRTAYNKGDYSAAIETGLKLVALDPENADYAYRLAAAYAREGRKDEALKWYRDSLK